ncbi:PilZ domain-containing protein [Geobacillus thermocatenulatus]|uniref:PilZ domain-containing protein n=1 Tax=Geobacillus thermocatenulatus TaxID=33938 RepID=A0A226Q2H0_9BACL|nr:MULTISPECIES: PilZ domain-containing protein [Geobacillus]ASS99472.1 pilus assembly protein PilZ [Geobacillus thermocatenulatus]KLR73068.1 pilus assembly protein PilZ [Geobacillus sp. T6]OXB85872.1 PilZ domain-containing protein [Geobacillus thermocatenulatus]RAN23172.1 pilus assembly protein PilZ [Geobacillus sp. A8]
MRFKRQEPFRYQFGRPLPAELRIADQHYSVLIHDISPHGMKLEAAIHLPFSHDGPLVEVSFALSGASFAFRGQLVWEKPFARIHYYGVRLYAAKQEEARLIEAIKRHVAESRRI